MAMVFWDTGGTSNSITYNTTDSTPSDNVIWMDYGGQFQPPKPKPELAMAIRQKSMELDSLHDSMRFRYEVEVTREALAQFRLDYERFADEKLKAEMRRMAEATVDDVVRERLVLPGTVLELPDGCTLHVRDDGSWEVSDLNEHRIYEKNNVRPFNPYVNAAELIGEFITYVREEVGVRPELVPELPMGLMVNWLVIEAAERDGDPVPGGVTPLPEDRRLVERVRPRCQLPTCRRFVRRDWAANGYPFCDDGGQHAAQTGRLLRRVA